MFFKKKVNLFELYYKYLENEVSPDELEKIKVELTEAYKEGKRSGLNERIIIELYEKKRKERLVKKPYKVIIKSNIINSLSFVATDELGLSYELEDNEAFKVSLNNQCLEILDDKSVKSFFSKKKFDLQIKFGRDILFENIELKLKNSRCLFDDINFGICEISGFKLDLGFGDVTGKSLIINAASLDCDIKTVKLDELSLKFTNSDITILDGSVDNGRVIGIKSVIKISKQIEEKINFKVMVNKILNL